MVKTTRDGLLLFACLISAVLILGCGYDQGKSDIAFSPPDDRFPDDSEASDDSPDTPVENGISRPQPADVWSWLTPRGLQVGKILGMATQMYDGPDPQWQRDFEIDKLVESGLLRLRASIDWGDVEPARDEWHLDSRDPFVELVTDAGLQFDGRLCYGVDWARPDGNDSALAPEDFAAYAGAVAGHYCGTIMSWEIWNEENVGVFWKPEPDPEHYGLLLKAAYTAIHDACPKAQVVFGGLSCLEADIFSKGLYYFLERVHEAHPDIDQYFDVLAIHPYTFLQTTTPEWIWAGSDKEIWPDMPGQIGIARERLKVMNAETKPIWLTEWGWPSLIIGNANQAHYLVRGALLAVSEGVEALDWYTFWDRTGPSFPPTEDYFGLFTSPDAEGSQEEKPAFRAARGLSIVLGKSRFAGNISGRLDLPSGAYGLAFIDEASGRMIFAAWNSERGPGVELALPCPPSANSFEILNEEAEIVSEGVCDQSVPVQLTGSVVYVRFGSN